MKKNKIIASSIILVIITVFCVYVLFIINKNIKDTEIIFSTTSNEVSRLEEKLNQQEANIKNDIEHIQVQIDFLYENDSLLDIDAMNETLNKALDEIEFLHNTATNNLSRIKTLEKELIKYISGAYNDYNHYYFEDTNNSYSIRFPKKYVYEINMKIPAGEDHEQIPGGLKIFLDKTGNEYIMLYLWHSTGVSSGMKDAIVKYISTNTGEIIEYVEYEIDELVNMDIGFSDHYLKIVVKYNKDNEVNYREDVMEIIKSVMFYDSTIE